MKRYLFLVGLSAISLSMGGLTSASAFSITFDWSGLKKCTSGNPNTVANPKFGIKNAPAGTAKIKFKMTDLNKPTYNHGGGTAAYSGGSSIKSGAFRYKSPCPPNGTHTYQWTATALDSMGKRLGVAKAKRKYP